MRDGDAGQVVGVAVGEGAEGEEGLLGDWRGRKREEELVDSFTEQGI